jgi:hypothetical protein
LARLGDIKPKTSPEKALENLMEAWQAALGEEVQPDEEGPELMPEAVLLERSGERENRFRYLTSQDF